MSKLSAILIGSESLTIACGRLILDRGHQIAAVVTEADAVRDWAQEAQLPVHEFGPTLAADLPQADWVLSIANLRLLSENVLTRGSKGAVNFHDGPLPRYAGLNAPVWARLNQETEHAITWHLIGDGIDNGALLAQEPFAIREEDTALTLNTKAFEAGLTSWDRVLTALESGAPETTAQDFTARSYFAKAKRPAHHGLIDPQGPVEDALALINGLDHGGYWNPLCTAKLWLGSGWQSIQSAARLGSAGGAAGTVLSVDGTELTLALANGALKLQLCAPADIKAGDVLTRPELDDPQVYDHAVTAEDIWRTALHDMVPSTCTVARGDATGTYATLDLETSDVSALLEATLALAAFETGVPCDIAFGMQPDALGLLSTWVPLKDSQARDAAISRGSFPADLSARDPQLGELQHPAFAFSETGPVAGALVTVTPGKLYYDVGALTPAAAQLIATRLAHLAQGRALTETPEAEAQQLTAWNETATDIDWTPLIQQIEAQAAKTPNAPALVVEHDTLTYGELNTRANQAAHLLQQKGVGPDSLVGLYCSRSLDLIVGALAIWKAGGAYVPLDPSYPTSRTEGYIEDSGVSVIVTQSALADTLPTHSAELLILDANPALAEAPQGNPTTTATQDNLAYLIFTSGSTGRPKGVMVEHGNLSNFCAGMDARLTHEPAGTWMAVTSLNFDISLLELFYTLSRGFKVVVTSDETRALISDGAVKSSGGMEFSLYYWGNDDGVGARKYELLLEGAKFADENGFCAVWTPERHFHAFGGPYPNPSVTGAAVAAVTKNIGVRAGSCVAPLHHPARIAEEWAVIDNLTNGRAGMAIASGWQPDDFILRPENTPPQNKPAMLESIETVRKLWRGEAVGFPKADGTTHEVITQPRPVSKELPVWVTTAGNPETWREAGRLGANVLTHLLGQSVDEVAGKIEIYHAALREAGYDPKERSVTLMLHTFLADSREQAEEIAREPMKDYLRSAAGLIKQYAWAFPAFKRPEGAKNAFDLDLGSLNEDELEGILDFAFLRYFEESGLFGTVDDAVQRVEALKAIGVTEVACLIDYGIAPDVVLEGLKPLAQVVAQSNQDVTLDDADVSIAAQLVRHDVTHLQCTPSMARMIAMTDEARAAMSGLEHIMIGGEALPGALVADLQKAAPKASVTNMYGPTETTIWSSTRAAEPVAGTVNLGKPIANTTFHVMDEEGTPVLIGQEGELYIGGAGVTRGYWQREELTAERFVEIGGERLYRTGDLVRWTPEGEMEFLGRVDHQIKLRGYRIELGEIEAALEALAGVRQTVVVAREDTPGDVRLVAYFTGEADLGILRKSLTESLPAHMVPSHFERLDEMPLTPNKKVDRNALPEPKAQRAVPETKATPPAQAAPPEKATGTAAPAGDAAQVEAHVSQIWRDLLGVAEVKPGDNFFDLGGHSLLAVQAHRQIKEELGAKLSITDIFRFPVLSALAAKIADTGGAAKTERAVRRAEPLRPTPVAAVAEAEPAMDAPVNERARARSEAMSKRRAMRAARAQR